MPALGVDVDRVLGDGQDDDRHAVAGVGDLLGERQALDPALEQGVDEDDVGPELLDLRQDLRCRRSGRRAASPSSGR